MYFSSSSGSCLVLQLFMLITYSASNKFVKKCFDKPLNWIHQKTYHCNSKILYDANAWGDKYPACKAGLQSPIHIEFMFAQYRELPQMFFRNYDELHSFTVALRGSNLLIIPRGDEISTYGGFLSVEYTFVLGAFHLGDRGSAGSEHRLNQKAYAAEFQLIHYTETNKDPSCFDKANGLMQFVILFEEIKDNNPELDEFIESIRALNEEKNLNKTVETSLFMTSFLPESTSNFYVYAGSLTFPPCTSNVITVVFDDPVKIGTDQVVILNRCDKYNVGCTLANAIGTTRWASVFASLKIAEIRLLRGSYLSNCEIKLANNLRQRGDVTYEKHLVYKSFKIFESVASKPQIAATAVLFVWIKTIFMLSIN